MTKPLSGGLCAVPLTTAFTGSGGTRWRNCCSADPQILSHPHESFEAWWYGSDLEHFRDQLKSSTLPKACKNCEISENIEGKSFRTAINSTVDLTKITLNWPKRWNISVGNLCNLACWTCSEFNSSVIEQHKKNVGLLPMNWQHEFKPLSWSIIEKNVLKSFDHHETIDLTLLGGEPLFNKTIIDFLESLQRKGLSNRTRLEFHTNCTIVNDVIKQILSKDSWQYLCMFASLDSVGHKAEWLRYGCTWKNIEKNLDQLVSMSNYLEVHCTLSILNILDLGKLKQFCETKKLPLRVSLLTQPNFMSIPNWDDRVTPFVEKIKDIPEEFHMYFGMIGTQPLQGAKKKLLDYIESFKDVRRSLEHYDKTLYSIIAS